MNRRCGHFGQTIQQGIGLVHREVLAGLVHAARFLFQPVVQVEDVADHLREFHAGRDHHERGEGAVIQPQFGLDGQWFSPIGLLGGHEEDLLLHADVAKEAGAELVVELVVDVARLRERPVQQGFQAAVVVGEEGVEGFVHGADDTTISIGFAHRKGHEVWVDLQTVLGFAYRKGA